MLLGGVKLDDEGHPELLPALARTLRQIERETEAKVVGEQIEKRAALRDALTTHFVREASSQQAAMEVAKAMMSMGRTWEAEGWAIRNHSQAIPVERLERAIPGDSQPSHR